MKLISYSVNNNKFILLENIVIKISKNTYNIYLNDTLYYSYNKKYFLKFIQENYNQHYQKINQLLSNKIQGGSDAPPPSDASPPSDAPPSPPSADSSVSTPATADTPAQATQNISEQPNPENTDKAKLIKIIENDYLHTFKILLILSKIIPSDIDLPSYVTKMYDEIKSENPSLIFTEQYLLNRINKMILKEVKENNVCTRGRYLVDFVPKKDDDIYKKMDKIIYNQLQTQRIKKLIDIKDVKNDNDVHFQYIFNIKEGGTFWDGDITDFLDKIFSSKEMEKNLKDFSTLIKYNLNESLENNNTGTLKSEEFSPEMFSFTLFKSTWSNTDDIEKALQDVEKYKDKYFIKTKYNIYSKQFETTVKFSKTEFDKFFNKGINKLASDELNNENISDYMKGLGTSLPELLNRLIKDKILNYIDPKEDLEWKRSDIFPTIRWNNYDEAYKRDMARKVKDMVFRHVDTNNLSLFNVMDLQNQNERLLKELIDNSRIKTDNDINNIIYIKYSKCSDIDINQCIENNKPTGKLICELVNFRDIKKLPGTFLDDFEYKRSIGTAEGMWHGFSSETKITQIGLIIKNVTEKLYIKTKELKIHLSQIFIDNYIKNFKFHIKETLHSFKFNLYNSDDYLNTQIQSVESYIKSLSNILNKSQDIFYSDFEEMDDILGKFKQSMKKEDPNSSTTAFGSNIKNQLVIKQKLLNLIIRFTIKINHIHIIKKNFIWNLNGQFLIYHLFDYINKKPTTVNILNDIKKITMPKQEVYKSLINTPDLRDKFNINIFELMDNKKLAKLKLQRKGDSNFINTSLSEPGDNKYKELDELEQLIFKNNILKESNAEFINSIMFFHKKLDKNWAIELDDNKQKYRDIYINKITRNIRNYYKNLLERQFNEVNNQHIDTLQKLGLNIPEEEISEDVELSAQLEDELTKLNDTKFKLFKDMQEKLNNVLKYIQSKNKTNPFFEYVIQKYVISERKFPFDFSSEYEKAQQQYNKNLSELLLEFSNIKPKGGGEEAKEDKAEEKEEPETVPGIAEKVTEAMAGAVESTGAMAANAATVVSKAVVNTGAMAANAATAVGEAVGLALENVTESENQAEKERLAAETVKKEAEEARAAEEAQRNAEAAARKAAEDAARGSVSQEEADKLQKKAEEAKRLAEKERAEAELKAKEKAKDEAPPPKCTANTISNEGIEDLYCKGETVKDYRRTSELVNPDKNPGCKDEANEKMQKLNNKNDECKAKFERWQDQKLQKHFTNIKTKMEKILKRLPDFWSYSELGTFKKYTNDKFIETLKSWDEPEFDYLQELFASILKEFNDRNDLPEETKEDIRYIQTELSIIDNFVLKNILPPTSPPTSPQYQQTQTQTPFTVDKNGQILTECPNCKTNVWASPGVLSNCNNCKQNFSGPIVNIKGKCPNCEGISEGIPNTVYKCSYCQTDFTMPKLQPTQTGGNNSQNMTYQCLSCNKNFTTSKLKGGSNSNQENLENFITKISQNLNEKSNPNNINVAISKLQLMYALENKDYRTLIQKYSKLSDSYNKLIKLEKINKVPITSKPAILTMIDKLFINNLTSNNEEDSEDEGDDLSNYSNTYKLDDEDSVQYKNKKQTKKIVKKIEYKLFDGLNLKNKEKTDENNNVVAFNVSSGEAIN